MILGFNPCVRCPHERTLVAKAGKNRILLQKPLLYTCSGQPVPRDVHFDHIYGPKFGSFLYKGSHVIVGRILYRNRVSTSLFRIFGVILNIGKRRKTFIFQSLHLCKFQIHVITRGCPTPKKILADCEDRLKPCNFTCKNPRYELHGASSLICGEDRKWVGILPVCKG